MKTGVIKKVVLDQPSDLDAKNILEGVAGLRERFDALTFSVYELCVLGSLLDRVEESAKAALQNGPAAE